ncbi:wiskott-Aldrich syndrome protein family member 1-like [Mesocricetus auratus]|uniref:Wiskott-Aldrich syndrome protein family member 1-like n=1 Tax=Mesocricetus auratus TaxID=10036 RepID=A0A1U7QXC4_MESAU|nr:wiskott-Aldrich syndrome protein family member 1-like [Mesocricetus auratus]
MSFNEEKFEQYLNQSGTITEIKDEFIYVILTSLNKIVRRVNDLDKYTEDLFGKLDKEIHSISFKLKILQENIIQLTDAITHKIPNEVLSMQVWKSRKTFPNITIETQQVQQVYSCTSLPVNIFERNNSNIAIPLHTVPSYYKNDTEDSSSSDGSFHSCLYCSKFVKENLSVNKEQTSEKHIKDTNLDHANEPKNMLQCRLAKEHISVDHIPSSDRAVSHSYLDQSDGGSLFYIFPLNKSKPRGKSVKNILRGEQEHPYYNIGHMSNSRPRVLYGTGKGDVVLSQPSSLLHHKTGVFVNPLAPKAPPLPSNWLIQLTSSESPSAHRVVGSINSPLASSLLVLETTTTTTTSACLKTTSNIDLNMPPEFTSTPDSLGCLKLKPDQCPQSQDHMSPPLLYPSIIKLNNKSWNSVVGLIDSALAVHPQQHSTCQPKRSSPQLVQSAKSLSISSSKSKSTCGSLPESQVPKTSGSLSAQSPRSSGVTPRSVSVSASSNTNTKLLPSPKRSVSHLTKLIEAQSRSPMTNLKGHLHSPQSKLSCFTSTKVTTLQSSLSSMKSTSVSSHRALAISQYEVVPTWADVKQNPSSFLPIMSKARKALMEAIRKGVRLRKTRENIPKGLSKIFENEADIIRFRRKAMGYNSGKSDSDTEWAEEA